MLFEHKQEHFFSLPQEFSPGLCQIRKLSSFCPERRVWLTSGDQGDFLRKSVCKQDKRALSPSSCRENNALSTHCHSPFGQESLSVTRSEPDPLHRAFFASFDCTPESAHHMARCLLMKPMASEQHQNRGRAHGMRNEMDMLLKRLRRTVQYSRLF